MTETVWLSNKSWTGVNIIYILVMNPSQQGIPFLQLGLCDIWLFAAKGVVVHRF